jgi:hypothetical protein
LRAAERASEMVKPWTRRRVMVMSWFKKLVTGLLLHCQNKRQRWAVRILLSFNFDQPSGKLPQEHGCLVSIDELALLFRVGSLVIQSKESNHAIQNSLTLGVVNEAREILEHLSEGQRNPFSLILLINYMSKEVEV